MAFRPKADLFEFVTCFRISRVYLNWLFSHQTLSVISCCVRAIARPVRCCGFQNPLNPGCLKYLSHPNKLCFKIDSHETFCGFKIQSLYYIKKIIKNNRYNNEKKYKSKYKNKKISK